jgi:hypothetical protein
LRRFLSLGFPLALTPLLAVLEELLEPAQEYRAAPSFGQPFRIASASSSVSMGEASPGAAFDARQKGTTSATEGGPTLRSRRDAPRFGVFSTVAQGTARAVAPEGGGDCGRSAAVAEG